ncbi:hypothetical protein DM02DRAFT_615231 [Periconia macrospinosa]|uniref:Uncharacterized protein n=1 Tax=Periconia macrospinosa TaxID=97972 RepID=A0A2V1DMP5_9PLEO|nr:hypothetical protein DM02DRAFT_615231 [Periconia macrospinosa]
MRHQVLIWLLELAFGGDVILLSWYIHTVSLTYVCQTIELDVGVGRRSVEGLASSCRRESALRSP